MRTRISLLILGLLIPLAACQDPASDPDAAPIEASAEREAVGTEPTSASSDTLTFLAIMQRLEGTMVRLSHALWLEDFDGIRERAAEIVDHPEIAPHDLERIESILGDEMAEFEEADEVVHDAASRLGDAAEAHDLDAILRELNVVQTGCVACHTRFRERVRTVRR